jgi:cell division protein FtsB
MEKHLDGYVENSLEPSAESQAVSRTGLKSLAVAAVAVAIVLYGALRDDEGVLRLFQEQDRVNELRRTVEDLRAENARLRARVQALREDARSIEGLAREDLGLAKPGETVFLLPARP